MDAAEYQKAARTTALYDKKMPPLSVKDGSILYTLMGLVGEVGEINEKFKKALRSGTPPRAFIASTELAKELGDVAWYLSQLSWELGWNLADVFSMNVQKLADRKERGVIRGEGDNR